MTPGVSSITRSALLRASSIFFRAAAATFAATRAAQPTMGMGMLVARPVLAPHTGGGVQPTAMSKVLSSRASAAAGGGATRLALVGPSRPRGGVGSGTHVDWGSLPPPGGSRRRFRGGAIISMGGRGGWDGGTLGGAKKKPNKPKVAKPPPPTKKQKAAAVATEEQARAAAAEWRAATKQKQTQEQAAAGASAEP